MCACVCDEGWDYGFIKTPRIRRSGPLILFLHRCDALEREGEKINTRKGRDENKEEAERNVIVRFRRPKCNSTSFLIPVYTQAYTSLLSLSSSFFSLPRIFTVALWPSFASSVHPFGFLFFSLRKKWRFH